LEINIGTFLIHKFWCRTNMLTFSVTQKLCVVDISSTVDEPNLVLKSKETESRQNLGQRGLDKEDTLNK